MIEIPKTCKAAVLFEYGAPLQIVQVDVPEVEEGGILVKVELAGICGTDIHMQEGTLGIKSPLRCIMGHEAVGRIVRLGVQRLLFLQCTTRAGDVRPQDRLRHVPLG